MRYGSDHKAETRERLLREAARAIKAAGPEGVGIAEVMRRAGLTHGGFYAHFPNKEALVAAALDRMFEEGAARFAKRVEGLSPAEALAHTIDAYLSPLHQDSVAEGCPLPALAADVARLSPALRARFGAGLARLQAAAAALFRGLGHEEAAAAQLAASLYAELAGAIALARACADPAQAAALRNGSRAALKARFGLSASRA
ncbi:TetR/AcrR family transcriptional regulator [Siccirubricoccus sp. KC 17139]|uniref:TetR/AcrR family transcriptional regulator n=1 Tax=Siccirubricoccus soli TaxID=2899147 RepID=A0ABT1D7L7_9PROT|nr:TetR/AcrR family transcriptional regulator [Siccirubricoccus soli]MCO6417874.1 TetR/AcrR family transcriptional regulator [Siccirubricoccus soli]MCP2684009.1 TetR/AcrR family transcriptional regulator [Siccirubricoccus soli]